MSRLAPLDVRWSASTAATSYFVGFDAFPAGMATIVEPAARSFTFDAPRDAFVGPASAFVEARVEPEDG